MAGRDRPREVRVERAPTRRSGRLAAFGCPSTPGRQTGLFGALLADVPGGCLPSLTPGRAGQAAWVASSRRRVPRVARRWAADGVHLAGRRCGSPGRTRRMRSGPRARRVPQRRRAAPRRRPGPCRRTSPGPRRRTGQARTRRPRPRPRSGRIAAHARACGPAAGMAYDREPVDAQRIGDAGDVGSRRRHFPAWLRRRSAVSGRSCDTQRMPRPAAAAISGSGGAPVFGVPWCQKTANPAAASPVPVS
jgi:hypothetical protein